MDEELEVLKQHVECLKLHEKATLSQSDSTELRLFLGESEEFGLASYVGNLKPEELHDLIVNTLYG